MKKENYTTGSDSQRVLLVMQLQKGIVILFQMDFILLVQFNVGSDNNEC